MGICSSCESTSVATAKLILQDGQLQEFSYPVKVSYVLQKNPTCFICNSDEMEFDDCVSAINGDDELHLGQLYFALPLSRLKHPLQAQEIAALAVKASSALMKSGGEKKCGCRRKGVAPVSFSGKVTKSTRQVAGDGEEAKRRRGRRGGGRGRNFPSKLISIPEHEQDITFEVTEEAVSSESMNLDSYIPHVPDNEELQLGQIYFLIPLSQSHTPLSLPDLCALAVKANAALSKHDADLFSDRNGARLLARSRSGCNIPVAGLNSTAGRGKRRVGY
ncbi:hypothetical protein HHK36_030847 [Tetracentron sinense]|uniref:Uncharacterized protein n=1 Tax=Tetracentron sinense TaxID=13715 RepID=A0A834YDH8_TETSI|nr:hypothetical protein HHK36_030847 [Tetracentron sinense]